MIARIPGVLVVPANSPAQSVRELIALAKSKPGALTFASGGNGSQAHFAGEMFKSAAGIDILHIPYKGAPEIMASLLSDQTSMGFPTLPTALPQVKAGKVRALAVTSLTRNPQLPEVPTMREAMDHGFDLNAWFGIVAPASVPPQIIARLNTEIVKILSDPEVRNKLERGWQRSGDHDPAGVRGADQDRCRGLGGHCQGVRRETRLRRGTGIRHGRPGYSAAIAAISTRYPGLAMRASTVARAGACPGSSHASQTWFI